MDIQSLAGPTVGSSLVVLVVALITRKQVLDVQQKANEATLAGKGMDAAGQVTGFFHDDAVAAQKLAEERLQAHLKCIEERATAVAENKRLTDCVREKEQAAAIWQDKFEKLDFEHRELETKLAGVEWLEQKIDLAALKALVAKREACEKME